MALIGKVLNLVSVTEKFIRKIQTSNYTFKSRQWEFEYVGEQLLNLKTQENGNKISSQIEIESFKILVEETSVGSNIYAPMKNCINFLSENIDNLTLSQGEILSFVFTNKQVILSPNCNKVSFISKSDKGEFVVVSVWRNRNFDLVAGSCLLENSGIETVYPDEFFNYLIVRKV